MKKNEKNEKKYGKNEKNEKKCKQDLKREEISVPCWPVPEKPVPQNAKK